MALTGTDAQTVRPYRESFRRVPTGVVSVGPYNRYSSRCTTTDAQTVRPYKSLHVR